MIPLAKPQLTNPMNKERSCLKQHAEKVAGDLSVLSKSRCGDSPPIIVGIAGPVAAGKTYFAEALFTHLKDKQLRFLHLPFEIWLDTFQEKDSRAPYKTKFYMSKYLRDISSLYVNRHATVYHTTPGRSHKIRLSHSSQDDRRVVQTIPDDIVAKLPPDENFSVDPDTGIVMRDISAARSDCIVIDGTLVFSEIAIIKLFTKRIYINRPLENRIAGMRRRFSEGRSHDDSKRIEEYVNYLTEEARFGADDLIRHQMASATEVYVNDQ